ncbi:hypothetical protein B0H63DRAFT_474618 [Podospora didyma]|uniref:Ankyrin repeat protein n=1 Tax=Podospora didyma TaxID=330526 RepID=A0AAE0NG61_9PEZI|nr:hypothetical protein B0H63DRAFT_474618 [Podospora didyma]
MGAASALAAVMHQLFEKNGDRRELMEYAMKRHRSHGPGLATNLSELWQILVHYVGSPDAGEVVCVLDAFDECEEGDRETLLEQIKGFYEGTRGHAQGGRLRFLITSRPHDGIELALGKLLTIGALVHLDGDGLSREISDEINLVIDEKLPTITASFTEQERRQISGSLKEMKQRTYLWLRLTFDIIKKAPSRFGRVRDLENLLANLPSEVSEAYEQILSRSSDRRQTETLLNIVIAAQRSLTLHEANIALTLALDDTVLASIDDLSPWPTDRFKGVVQNLCGMLVTVCDGKLALIHQTARDFLLSPDSTQKDGAWRGCLSLAKAHRTISHACLHYLRLLAEHTSTASQLYLDPKEYQALQHDHYFLSYAAAHWPTHFVEAEMVLGSKPAIHITDNDHALALCDQVNAHVWAPQHFSRGSFLRWWTWTKLALAAYIGLAPVVEEILSQCSFDDDISLNMRCSDFGTPLQTAAAGGHESVVRVLLDKGAEVDQDGNIGHDDSRGGNKGYGTALRIAAARGYRDVVGTLLKHGANASCQKGKGTALEAARAGGHEDVVEILTNAERNGGGDNPAETSIEESGNESGSEMPLLPSWFDHDDFEAEMFWEGTPRHQPAQTSAWDNGRDGDSRLSPTGFPLPGYIPPEVSLKRAMALQYMIDAEGSYEFTELGEGHHKVGQLNMSVPWLRT